MFHSRRVVVRLWVDDDETESPQMNWKRRKKVCIELFKMKTSKISNDNILLWIKDHDSLRRSQWRDPSRMALYWPEKIVTSKTAHKSNKLTIIDPADGENHNNPPRARPTITSRAKPQWCPSISTHNNILWYFISTKKNYLTQLQQVTETIEFWHARKTDELSLARRRMAKICRFHFRWFMSQIGEKPHYRRFFIPCEPYLSSF